MKQVLYIYIHCIFLMLKSTYLIRGKQGNEAYELLHTVFQAEKKKSAKLWELSRALQSIV